MDRREFLKTAAVASAALAAGRVGEIGYAEEGAMSTGSIPKRRYGNTEAELSIVGFGGIVVMNAEQEHANRIVAEAVERGINYFDVAPSYGDAELKLGPALKPYRKDVFLACKTGRRDAAGAKEELERSLERLQTDYFDLYQLHAITDVEKDVEAVFAKGGAWEVISQAHREGRIRYLGFSAHSIEAAIRALELYPFDSVLFPVNFANWYQGRFGPQIMEAAQRRGAARLALKALAKQRWPKDHPDREKYRKCWYQPVTDRREAELALRWTLSQPVTAAIPPGEESLFRLAVEIASEFRPITQAETQELQELAANLNPIFSIA